ncbi:sugar ABC transporter substrate-binding protein [Paenibacillus sp. sptzw28]|uniref:ABC transporter substrate-binding protein n=1 Tax=Paenibacillus sp. sptzw28 TaxID=715179 RepID=UPI001C6EC408|nr:sugar ABC transporter substrate-binding protein [Paenibacillus sp. sptzw28]QYR22735.1 sugar ABC transporter substrate-binding protein [Paenibacillus sp. sptzw28]
MKKLFSSMLTVTMLSIVLAACSNPGGDQSKNATNEPQNGGSSPKTETVTLKFWRPSGNDAENGAISKLIENFEAKNPGIKVDLENVPFDNYETKVRTALAGKTAGDIIAIDAPTMSSYANAGALYDLTSFMEADADLKDIPEGILQSMKYDGKYYIAPISEANIALFYNKKMFEAKGIPLPSKNVDEAWTWDQVLDAAKKLNDPAKGVYGIDPAQGFGGGEGPAYFKTPILWQFGAEVLSPDGSTAKGYLDSKEAKEALTFYQSLYQTYKVSPLELPPDPFPTGKVAMFVDGIWDLANFTTNFPNFKLGEDWDIAPLPKAKRQAMANGSWTFGVTADSKYPKEAWQLINYMTGTEGAKIYADMTGALPVRYSVVDQTPKMKEYPYSVFVGQLQKYSMPRPVTPAYPAVSAAIRELFEDVGQGNRDVNAAAADAVKKIDDAIEALKR